MNVPPHKTTENHKTPVANVRSVKLATLLNYWLNITAGDKSRKITLQRRKWHPVGFHRGDWKNHRGETDPVEFFKVHVNVMKNDTRAMCICALDIENCDYGDVNLVWWRISSHPIKNVMCFRFGKSHWMRSCKLIFSRIKSTKE